MGTVAPDTHRALTSKQKMETSPALSLLLLLLLGFSQANSNLMENDVGKEKVNDDITTRILSANKDSSELLLEGDMVLPKTRNAMKCWNDRCLWKKSAGGYVLIPYTISDEFTPAEKSMIVFAMKNFHARTCIRFTPLQAERDYISIVNQGGCFSALGKNGGEQPLSLKRNGCIHQGVIQHELLHALGFQHEHTRSDRDQYIRINWDNIQPDLAFNFHKKNTNNLNTPYDYHSIMHYGNTAFALVPGKDTITPIPDSSVWIGQRNAMSRTDILRINKLYGC